MVPGGLAMAYADVEIRIFKKENDRYPAEITVNSEREFPRGYLDAGGQPATPTSADYADDKYGEALFRWLFADKTLSNAWAEIRGAHPQRRVRLRIDADEPELHRAVWEALRDPCDGGIPLALATTDVTPFSRYLALPSLPGKPVFSRPIRILLVAPAQADFRKKYPADKNPDLAEIDPAAELKSLTTALQELIDRGAVTPPKLLPQPCSLARIMDELRNGNGGKGYHLLHLVCHGDFNPHQQRARLWLATDDNLIGFLTDEDFARSLHELLGDATIQDEDRLRLVFLASCESAKRSPANTFRGVAPQLVKAGVPAVVAMQDQVGDQTAREFAGAFYQQLLKEGQVDLAANVARAQITAKHLPGPVIPVLFLRLRDGSLLGRRGDVVTHDNQSFWPGLLRNIQLGRCTLFIGPNLNEGLLPDREQLAKRLAVAPECSYPLSDRSNLARVAQYFALREKDLMRTDYLQFLAEGLLARLDPQSVPQDIQGKVPSEVITPEAWYEKTKTIRQNEPYHLLADLPMSLYVTTNVDNFMYAALRGQGKEPRQEQPHWKQQGAQANSPRLPEKPTKDRPVVFHLNGLDSDPKHIVLSEDDYMTHLVRLAHEQLSMLPIDVTALLSLNSLVFVGYNLDDWEFRVVLQGLIKPIAQAKQNEKRHVGVQLDIHQDVGEDQVKEYLVRYLGQYQIDIYRGSALEFARELHSRWKYFQEHKNYDWWS
jgi:hypothetical protein